MRGTFPFHKLKQMINTAPDKALLTFGCDLTEGVLDIYTVLNPDDHQPAQAVAEVRQSIESGSESEQLLRLADDLLAYEVMHYDQPARLAQDKNPAYQLIYNTAVDYPKGAAFNVATATYELKRFFAWVNGDGETYANLSEQESARQMRLMQRILSKADR